MTLFRGKLPPRFTLRAMRSAIAMSATLDALGPPPPSSNNYMAAVAKIPCQMYGNDECGDCVEADTGHTLTIRTANAAIATVVPTKNDVLDLYCVFGYDPARGKDPGTDELSMCEYLKATGFLGHKLDDSASIDPQNLDHIKWAIQLFGSCRVGWALPDYAEQQFNYKQPWHRVPGVSQHSSGGHDTPLVHYEGDDFFTTTWGRWMQPVTRVFIKHFCEEARAELAYDWIKEQGQSPSGFDLATLEQKMKQAAA